MVKDQAYAPAAKNLWVDRLATSLPVRLKLNEGVNSIEYSLLPRLDIPSKNLLKPLIRSDRPHMGSLADSFNAETVRKLRALLPNQVRQFGSLNGRSGHEETLATNLRGRRGFEGGDETFGDVADVDEHHEWEWAFRLDEVPQAVHGAERAALECFTIEGTLVAGGERPVEERWVDWVGMVRTFALDVYRNRRTGGHFDMGILLSPIPDSTFGKGFTDSIDRETISILAINDVVLCQR